MTLYNGSVFGGRADKGLRGCRASLGSTVVPTLREVDISARHWES